MKKLYCGLLMWIIFSADCFAMTFSQPVKIGEVILPPMGFFDLKGYSYHDGTLCKEKGYERLKLYEKGIARFGEGKDALYFHYDVNKKVKIPDSNYYGAMSRFGSQDVKNAVQVWIGIPTIIWKIKTDSDITFYMLEHGDASGLVGTSHTLIGKRKDGSFVEYFYTYEVKRRYFDKKIRRNLISDEWGKYFFDEDTIILRYGKYMGYNNDLELFGEFRFKWDDAAQWFGIEQVVY